MENGMMVIYLKVKLNIPMEKFIKEISSTIDIDKEKVISIYLNMVILCLMELFHGMNLEKENFHK
jgi:hypothetical protein